MKNVSHKAVLLFASLAIIIMTSGCATSPAVKKFLAQQHDIRIRNAAEATRLLDKKTIEHCRKVSGKGYFNTLRFISPFRFSPSLTRWFQTRRTIFPMFDKRSYDDKLIGNLVTLAARMKAKDLFGISYKSFAGCTYFLHDGKLEFFKKFGPTSLKVRY